MIDRALAWLIETRSKETLKLLQVTFEGKKA
jgi:hypothetical protein